MKNDMHNKQKSTVPDDPNNQIHRLTKDNVSMAFQIQYRLYGRGSINEYK